jgi:hypothetical protein
MVNGASVTAAALNSASGPTPRCASPNSSRRPVRTVRIVTSIVRRSASTSAWAAR